MLFQQCTEMFSLGLYWPLLLLDPKLHMRWLASRILRRCATAIERAVATAHAAPLPLRITMAGIGSAVAACARLALLRASDARLPDAVEYLVVILAGLLGGPLPGVLAAFAGALSLLWLSDSPLGERVVAATLFIVISACVLALEAAYRHLRLRSDATVSEQIGAIALATPGVVGTFFLDEKRRVAYRYVSPKAKAVFGLDPGDICADAGAFYKRLDPSELETINQSLFRSARDLSLWVCQFSFAHPEKGAVWMEAQGAPVREKDGSIVWHGYASDITSRKSAELSLAESAARLQATVDAAQDAVLTMEESGRLQTVNRAGVIMFGYGPGEIAAMNVGALISLDGEDEKEWTPPEAGERVEIMGRRKGGASFPAELTLGEATFGGKNLRVAFIKDLTEQRMIEHHLGELYRSRFKAIGGMAAELAHEINQPLAANATYLRVARRLLEQSPHAGDAAIIEVLDKAAAQTLRAGRIVTSLRELVRSREPDKTMVCLHEVIGEAREEALENSEIVGVQFELRLRAAEDCVIADRAQLKQVFASLIRNAVEAMQSSERRDLVIETSNPGDGTIRIDVIDSGCGLPESSDIGCFEPFTTTKTKGMGVGLSISHTIIEAHYGRIWAAPNASGGAVFSFTLPLQDAEVDA